jgi:hypothetical protein
MASMWGNQFSQRDYVLVTDDIHRMQSRNPLCVPVPPPLCQGLVQWASFLGHNALQLALQLMALCSSGARRTERVLEARFAQWITDGCMGEHEEEEKQGSAENDCERLGGVPGDPAGTVAQVLGHLESSALCAESSLSNLTDTAEAASSGKALLDSCVLEAMDLEVVPLEEEGHTGDIEATPPMSLRHVFRGRPNLHTLAERMITFMRHARLEEGFSKRSGAQAHGRAAAGSNWYNDITRTVAAQRKTYSGPSAGRTSRFQAWRQASQRICKNEAVAPPASGEGLPQPRPTTLESPDRVSTSGTTGV